MDRLDPWRGLMAEVSQNKNVFCKLSGMITEADQLHWSADDLRPYFEHVLKCFGIDRVMFGSDWPVCLLAGSYDQVVAVVRELLSSSLDESAEQKLFGANAERFYKLGHEVKMTGDK